MSVKCRRAVVPSIGEAYLVVSRYDDHLERVEIFTDFESANVYARTCAQYMNRYWSFAVLPFRLPAEMHGTIYRKDLG